MDERFINLINETGDSPLHRELRSDCNLDTIKHLLHNGANVNSLNDFKSSPLHHAVKNSNCELEVIRLLLQHGAKVSIKNCFLYSPLHNAVMHAKFDVIALLLEYDACIDTKNIHGHTPFYYATKESKADVIRLFLEKGVEINEKDKNGDFPLHVVLKSYDCKFDAVKILLVKGADANVKNDQGYSPLQCAVRNSRCNEVIIKLLLRNGANANETDEYKDSVLHTALKYNCSFGIVKELVEHGFDPNNRNMENCTPLEVAVTPRYFTPLQNQAEASPECIIKLLIKYTLLNIKIKNLSEWRSNSAVLSHYARECEHEIHRMRLEKIANNFTLLEFVCGQHYLQSDATTSGNDGEIECDINRVLAILINNEFPLYGEVISAKVKRSSIINKLTEQSIYTVVRCSNVESIDNRTVTLDCNSVLCLAKYLENADLINLLLAFYTYECAVQSPVSVSSSSPEQSSLGKRLQEEHVESVKHHRKC